MVRVPREAGRRLDVDRPRAGHHHANRAGALPAASHDRALPSARPCIDEVRALPSPAVMLSATVPAVSGRGRRRTRWPLPPPALPNRSCSCRERNQARAPRGDQAPTGHVFSVLHAISQGGPSPSARNCGAGAPFAPTRWRLPCPFATMQAPRNPALRLVHTRLSWPPSAQSPFGRNGCYPRRGVVAHTGSCARPPPSPRLRFARCARGLCRFSPVPAGRWPFPTSSLRPLCRCSDPTQARR